MQNFLEIVEKNIDHPDSIVRDFIGFMLRDFPYTPSKLVNQQLERAIEAKEQEKISILIDANKKSVNEQTLPILLKLFANTRKEKHHLIKNFLEHLSVQTIIEHEEQLKPYLQKDFFKNCHFLAESNENELWAKFHELMNQLEKHYNSSYYALAEKVQNQLIDMGSFNKEMIQKILDEELTQDWFSYLGIFAVRAVGILKLEEFIPTLAPLLVRDDDILLEETAKALNQFQNDEVVKAVTPFATDLEGYFFAIGVLKQTKSPLVEEVLVASYPRLPVDGKEMVLDALTAHFSEKAFPLIEDFLHRGYYGGVLNMDELFYGFYTVMGRTHPDMEDWKNQLQEKDNYFTPMDHELVPPPFFKPKSQPITSEKISRNGPCPCGSEKKYKKCCGKS